jgi:DNA polymerase-3 subunit epsilon
LHRTIYTILDLETTGLDEADHRIIELGIAAYTADGKRIALFHSLLDAERSIPDAATDVHGIKDADVREEPKFSEAAPFIRALLNCYPVVMVHSDFHLRFLRAEFSRSKVNAPKIEHVELLDLGREVTRNKRIFTLSRLCDAFGVDHAGRNTTTLGSLELVNDVYRACLAASAERT